MFTFVVSHAMPLIMFFSLNERLANFFYFWWENTKEGAILKWGGNHPCMKLWYRGKEILLNEVFDLTHKENIRKTKDAITPIANTPKLCALKYYVDRSQRQCKKRCRSGKK